jgi:hypothetical protein
VCLPGNRDVVGEAAMPGDERRVLAADGGSIAAEPWAGTGRWAETGGPPNPLLHADPDPKRPRERQLPVSI